MVFIDMWSLFGGYIFLFNQGSVTRVLPLQCGLYLEVAFHTGLTVLSILTHTTCFEL